MAYVENQDDEEENQDQPAVSTGPASGVLTSSSGGANAPQGTPAAKPANTPDNPGNFVGINRYLDANKAGARKLGQDVSSVVSNQGGVARNALNEGVNQFNQAVNQNTVGVNQGLLDEAKNDSANFVKDENKVAQFQKQKDATYAGPANLQSTDYFSTINQELNKAKEYGKDTTTEEGRKTLIQKTNPNKFTSGGLNLDNLLVQNNEAAKQSIGQAKQGLGDLDQKLSEAQTQSADKAVQAQAQNQATQKAVQDQFSGENGALNQLKGDVNSRTQAAIQKAGENSDLLMRAVNENAPLTDEQLGFLGMSRDDYDNMKEEQRTYKLRTGLNNLQDASSFFTKQNPNTLINAGNVATADDYAKYAALNDLMGTQNDFLTDPSKAGTASLDAIDFDSKSLRDQIKTGMAAKDAENRAKGVGTLNYDGSTNYAGAGLGAVAGSALGPMGSIIGAAVGSDSFLCSAMLSRGFISQDDYIKIHSIYEGYKNTGILKWYHKNGSTLVGKITDWNKVKQDFFTKVVSKPQKLAEKAYLRALKRLTNKLCPGLWDDSLMGDN